MLRRHKENLSQNEEEHFILNILCLSEDPYDEKLKHDYYDFCNLDC